MTPDELLELERLAERALLIAEKRQIHGMTIALVSLFQSQALKEHFAELDRWIAKTERPGATVPPGTQGARKMTEEERLARVRSSIEQLEKLKAVFQQRPN